MRRTLDKKESNTQPIIITPSPTQSSDNECILINKEEVQIRKNPTSNHIVTTTDSSVRLVCDGTSYKFLDVPGDGNCFYHSLLLNENFSRMFADQRQLRNKFVEDTINAFGEDPFVRYIFEIQDINFNRWCERTVRYGTWGGNIEAGMLTLLYEINIRMINASFELSSSVNYLETMYSHFVYGQPQTRTFDTIQNVHVFHHRFKNIHDKNPLLFDHFGFLEPLE